MNGIKTHKQDAAVFLGVTIGREPLQALTAAALAAIEGVRPQIVFACANSHSLAVTQTDPEFFAALNNAEQVVADGVGLTLMAKLAGMDVGPRIAGEQYFFSVMQALRGRGHGRVFFFGSSEQVLQRIEARFAREFPSLELCGVLSPPFRPWSEAENNSMIERINTAKPDVLWVGMTAPRQEKWVYRNRSRLNVRVIGSIGAVFDFFAETVASPPEWVRRYGLETVYRFLKEPKRLWYRVFISNGKFVLLALRKHVLGSRR